MTPAQKGERYARLFRKAGALIGKRSTGRAVKTLKEGAALAKEWGDGAMLRRFEAEIARIGEPAPKDLEKDPPRLRHAATTASCKDGRLPH